MILFKDGFYKKTYLMLQMLSRYLLKSFENTSFILIQKICRLNSCPFGISLKLHLLFSIYLNYNFGK